MDPFLSQSIPELIIDAISLWTDRYRSTRALTSCSLASRSLLPRSRFHLFPRGCQALKRAFLVDVDMKGFPWNLRLLDVEFCPYVKQRLQNALLRPGTLRNLRSLAVKFCERNDEELHFTNIDTRRNMEASIQHYFIWTLQVPTSREIDIFVPSPSMYEIQNADSLWDALDDRNIKLMIDLSWDRGEQTCWKFQDAIWVYSLDRNQLEEMRDFILSRMERLAKRGMLEVRVRVARKLFTKIGPY
ncbi:uncharacterized protein EV420DRAFT_1592799 [Desarmillaria tabescens]|uniref:Uncharacterized protein n=1 Tax=Armillaria tabescens TaxID=1929756 RepID=A0AA39J5E7_ARMTA|nr:uncharacterized protein EV420DRAFT_1592799 [Desarmillaria tabescens]KAK0435566.1 hypothetical protein EV420DRAFT_1592799 [Desarmillaria tabescens]